MKKLVKFSIYALLVWAFCSYMLFCLTNEVVFFSQTIIGAALAVVVLHVKYQTLK